MIGSDLHDCAERLPDDFDCIDFAWVDDAIVAAGARDGGARL